MAITDVNTVLILGAGVSVPFGLPTGAQLIDNIAKNLEAQIEQYSSNSDRYFSANKILPASDLQNFLRFPYLQPLLWKIDALDTDLKTQIDRYALDEKLYEEFQKMLELKTLLQNQTSDSIDDFIVLNPSYAEYTKICIAAEFIQSLYKASKEEYNNDYELEDVGERFLATKDNFSNVKERNWIHRLINLIRLGVAEGKVTTENKIQIITFNYDTILEYVLEQQFTNFERGEEDFSNYRNFIEITHVHGQCGELKETINIPGKTCWEWSQGIKVIREHSESIPETIKQARKNAKSLISYASEIYCCGFAFAKANTDLIELANTKQSRRKIYYCNFSNDVGLKNAAEKFIHQSRSNSSMFHTQVHAENDIGVADWIGIGTLGELP